MTDPGLPFDLSQTDRLLTTTRAVRKRLDLTRPVEPSVILDCLRIATQAPSGGNTQRWRWMIVTDPDKKRPIADYYAGYCPSQPGETIDSDKLRVCCNRGYARERCEFAAAADADAIRLLVKAEHDGLIEIAWSIERNHHPVGVGTMPVGPDFAGSTPLEHQAAALAKAYRDLNGERI